MAAYVFDAVVPKEKLDALWDCVWQPAGLMFGRRAGRRTEVVVTGRLSISDGSLKELLSTFFMRVRRPHEITEASVALCVVAGVDNEITDQELRTLTKSGIPILTEGEFVSFLIAFLFDEKADPVSYSSLMLSAPMSFVYKKSAHVRSRKLL